MMSPISASRIPRPADDILPVSPLAVSILKIIKNMTNIATYAPTLTSDSTSEKMTSRTSVSFVMIGWPVESVGRQEYQG